MSDFWCDITRERRAIVIYGTGDGAEKLYNLLKERGVRTSAFVASSEFLRDRSFLGYKVLSLERAKEIYGDYMILLLGFGTHKEDVIKSIVNLDKIYDLYIPDLLTDKTNNPITREYLRKNRERIEWAYSLLSDEKSREVFRLALEYKLSGRIEPLLKMSTKEEDNWDLLNIEDNEIYFDCGAYNGDTAELFLSKVNSYKKIILIEPERRSYKRLKDKFENYKDIEIYNSALSSEEGRCGFIEGRGRGSRLEVGDSTSIKTIDSILSGEKATIIKFDIEGEEENALEGGRSTINTYKPKLYLSAYHRIDDFWVLLEKVWSIRKDYKVYMRKNPCLPLWDVDYILI